MDLPDGTLWRIDVPFDVSPFGPDIEFGEVPEDALQRVPKGGAPDALISGETYYLYVLKDVALPIARCIFEAP